jgi:hypothetical protein
LFILLALSLRLANPHEVPVDAVLRCGDATRTVTVGARGVVDVPRSAGCTSADAQLPLTVLELSDDGEEWQQPRVQVLSTNDGACSVPPLWVPSFACRNGVATAYVEPADGAAYEWTAEGADIISGAGTHRVTVQLTDPSLATLRVKRSTGSCAGSTSGVIHVREPIVVKEFSVPQNANADQPVTLRWSYEPGREPNAQLLAGDAFPQPVPLGVSQRSYTFTPKSSGPRTVELRASYAQTIVTAPPKRRRAASGAMTSASECPAARASAKMNVAGCTEQPMTIDVPEDVLAGATFYAGAPAGAGQNVEWSVENGIIKSISPLKELVEITAGAGGKVRITARIEQKPGCFTTTEAEVAILLPAEQCAVPPSATLTLGARDCDSAQVVAHFTGTPPFAGRWSDGREFRTAANVLTHEFTNPGNYTIAEFRDSTCFGNASTLSVDTIKPTVRLEELSNSCGVVRFAVHFSGVPPFTAVWSDWEPIQTMEHRIERTVRIPGGWDDSNEWQIHNFRDAVCDRGPASNILRPFPVAEAGVSDAPHCQTSPVEGALVYVFAHRGYSDFQGPTVAEWADGTVSSTTTNVATRRLPPISTPAASFELKRVTFAGCEADLTGTTANVVYRPTAQVAANLPSSVCAGEQLTARLSLDAAPDALLRWSARGDYATALSPSDGDTFLFTSRLGGKVWVSVATDHLDGKCNGKSNEVAVLFDDPADVVDLKLEPAVIPRGGSSRITWTRQGDFLSNLRVVLPPDRAGALVMESWGAMFLDKVGPGEVPITFEWTDCRGTHSKSVTLTITP